MQHRFFKAGSTEWRPFLKGFFFLHFNHQKEKKLKQECKKIVKNTVSIFALHIVYCMLKITA